MHNLPSPVLDEIRREFLADTDEILGTLEELLPVVREGNRAQGRAALDETYRRIHSLKGSAGMFGFAGVSTLCHELEEFLDSLRHEKRELGSRDLGLLGRAIALLRNVFSRATGSGDMPAPRGAEMETLGADLRARRLAGTGAVLPAPHFVPGDDLLSDLALLSSEERARIAAIAERGHVLYRFDLASPAAHFAHELDIFKGRVATPLELVATLPGATHAEGIIAQAFLVGGPPDALEALRAQEGRALASAVAVPVQAVLGGPISETQAELARRPDDATPPPGSVRVASLRVRLDELELLTEIAGELHLASGKLFHRLENPESADWSRAAQREILDDSRHLTRRIGDLRRRLLALRMVPIRPVLTRFFPIVQSLAWESGREIELRVIGEETRVDRNVLEGLGEPLLHLVRNAVDHGLEPPDERVAAGKDRRGVLVLEARAEDRHVTVEVRDDGRGVDRRRVERKARERGLLGTRESHGDEDLWRCLFSPGFTTRDQATELSGRGIGLDVVRRAVLSLQGLVEIVSTPGMGTRVLLRLPQSLTVTRGLVVRQGQALFAFPLHSIVGVRALRDGRPMILARVTARSRPEGDMPLLDLERFFALRPPPVERRGRRSVVLAGVAEKRLGIVVEKIISQEELLVRPLGPLLAEHPGLSGVAELAGGDLALVVDISALIAFAEAGSAQRKETCD